VLTDRVDTPFRRPLLASFRDDAGGVRAVAECNRQHFIGRCHFEIEWQGNLHHQPLNVGVADMPTVLAQVCGNAVGPGLGGDFSGPERIGMIATASIADGCDVIDVHAEA
jgi:hypothetical protein